MFDEQIEKLQSPSDFIPNQTIDIFSETRVRYRLVSNIEYLAGQTFPPPQTNDAAVNDIQDLLINSVIMSYEGNWMLITQVEAYYHEKKTDDVAQNDSHFSFGKKLDIAFEKV